MSTAANNGSRLDLIRFPILGVGSELIQSELLSVAR